MKNLFIILTLATLALTSCREQKTETKEVIREVHVESVESTDNTPEPESEGILERTAKKVDDEVNKEIDQEIQKIGDDN